MRVLPSRITLKSGREAAALRRHPWVFSGAIQAVEGSPAPGALVAVHDANRRFVAWGHYSPESQIRVRLFSWSEASEPETTAFWRMRLQRALGLRDGLRIGPTTAYRLVNAESDGIPGLIVDRYGDTLVVQLLTASADRSRDLYADLLLDLAAPATIYERSDAEVREHEGLSAVVGLLRGTDPAPLIRITEHGLSYVVDVRSGHKTGFYLDQRESRKRFRDLAGGIPLAGGEMLNVFSYTGAFTICGLAGGIGSAVNVDTSSDALALGQRNLGENQLPADRVEDLAGDAFEVLRRLRRQGRTFDAVVLDPPKFAFTQRDVARASRGYKDINMQAIHLLKPGGVLFTFSCSGAISEDLFQKIVFGAALDTDRDVQIIGRLSQGSDHPVALTFPEGAYLKGLVCRVVS